MRVLAISALILFAGCKQYQPAESLSNLSAADAARECKNKQILAPKTGSKVTWQVVSTKEGAETVLNGSNGVSGFMELRGKDLGTASGKFYFDAKSTSTGDRERDSKLMDIVFGLGQKSEFSFLLTSVKGGTLSAGSAQGIEASGTLLIDGQTANVSIPLIMTERNGIYKLESKGDYLLNMRALKGERNGINLVAELNRLLNFVPGMGVKDNVAIRLNLDLDDLCS